MKYYRLKEDNTVERCTEREFKQYVEGLPEDCQLSMGRLLAHDRQSADIDDVQVLTAFEGVDRSPDAQEIHCFQTVIVGGKHSGEQQTYATYDDAIAGHNRHVDRVFLF